MKYRERSSPALVRTDDSRLNQAREFGFDKTVKVDLKWNKLEFAAKVREVMGGDCPPEVAFECTGAQSSIVGSIYVRSALLPLETRH